MNRIIILAAASLAACQAAPADPGAIWHQVGGTGPAPKINTVTRAAFDQMSDRHGPITATIIEGVGPVNRQIGMGGSEGADCGITIGTTIYMPADRVTWAGCLAAEFDHVVRIQRGDKLTRAQLECSGDLAAEDAANAAGEYGLAQAEHASSLRDCDRVALMGR